METDNLHKNNLDASVVQPFLVEQPPTVPAKKEWISCRYSFAVLGLFGFFNLYALRVNLSVAIVAMVRAHQAANGTAPAHGTCPYPNSTGSTKHQEGEFTWDTGTQGILLGAFFYGYIFTQMPGAWIAKRFGAKHPFGFSALFAGLLSLLIPVAARWHYGAVIAVRFFQGISEGVCFPSAHTLIGKWTPPMERTRIVSIVYSGQHVGTVGTLLLSGLLADYFGWDSIFYFFGATSVLWYIVWLIFGYESPEVHPRISAAEKEYIQTSIGHSASHNTNLDTIPWKSILTNKAVWAIAVGHFGNNWGYYTLLTNLPTYLSNILHFKLKENGLNSSLPYLAMAIIMPISGFTADLLRRKRILSTTNVRRIFHFLGVGLPAVCLVAVGYTGCNVVIAMVLMTFAVGFNGFATSAGFQVNHIDLSPTFGGILMGLTNTLGTIPGIVGPYVAGAITTDQTTGQWLTVFFISAGIYLITGIIYAIFCSGESQGWERKKSVQPQEEAS